MCPANVAQVQAVVRGSVTVDLKRMNRVLEVDEKCHCALVGPGVSYLDFYRYNQEYKLKVWVDTADVGWGGLCCRF